MATGPHLDYRVYLDGKPINPLTVTGIPLPPVRDKARFESVKKDLLAELNRELPLGPPRPWPIPNQTADSVFTDN
jgi:hypothetical protein